MEFGVHDVETHMRKTDLKVVYTNDPVMVDDSINTMKRLLAHDDRYTVLGFDLAYTSGRAGHDQKVVIAELFVNSPDYRFATVDTTNIPDCQKLVGIRGHYKIWGSKKEMYSHVDLVEAIIDPYYEGMKAECDKNMPAWHRA
ncbi:hypothetical protein D1007_32238 [Hordeum vulgare]|nr:hypothetical protein D1007_32238 [Hordeum vulgare]